MVVLYLLAFGAGAVRSGPLLPGPRATSHELPGARSPGLGPGPESCGPWRWWGFGRARARCPILDSRCSLLAARAASGFSLLASRCPGHCPLPVLAACRSLAIGAYRLAPCRRHLPDCLRLRPGGFLLMSVLLLPAGVAGRGSDAGRGRLPPLEPAQCPVPSRASCFAVSPIPMPIPSKPQPRSPQPGAGLAKAKRGLERLKRAVSQWELGAGSLRAPFSGE
jgi:hypothetical protein